MWSMGNHIKGSPLTLTLQLWTLELLTEIPFFSLDYRMHLFHKSFSFCQEVTRVFRVANNTIIPNSNQKSGSQNQNSTSQTTVVTPVSKRPEEVRNRHIKHFLDANWNLTIRTCLHLCSHEFVSILQPFETPLRPRWKQNFPEVGLYLVKFMS